MYCRYYECNSLTSLNFLIFTLINVTNMSFMFFFFGCSSLTSLNLRNFDRIKVANIGRCFFFVCFNLSTKLF